MMYLLLIISFLIETMELLFGAGYGTIMTPLLIWFGYEPLSVLIIILLLQGIVGLISIVFNQFHETINLFKKKNLKVSLILVAIGLFGALGGAFFALEISKLWLELIIALMVLVSGALLMIARFVNNEEFSYYKLGVISLIASFAKAVSGIYGPIITSGQMILGMNPKKSVARTIFIEGIVSFSGFLIFSLFIDLRIDLFLPLLGGVLLAVPLSTYLLKKIKKRDLKRGVGLFIMILGLILIIKVLFGFS